MVQETELQKTGKEDIQCSAVQECPERQMTEGCHYWPMNYSIRHCCSNPSLSSAWTNTFCRQIHSTKCSERRTTTNAFWSANSVQEIANQRQTSRHSTDSKRLHRRCHLRNKVENTEHKPDIPHTLQWAGRRPQNCLFPTGVTEPPSNMWFLWPTPVHTANGIRSAVSAQWPTDTQTDRQTDRRTDGQTDRETDSYTNRPCNDCSKTPHLCTPWTQHSLQTVTVIEV